MFAVYRIIKETDSCLLLLNQQQSNGLKTSSSVFFFFSSLLLWKCQCCKLSLQEKWVEMRRLMTSMICALPVSQVRSSGHNPNSQNISYRYLEPIGLGKKTVNVHFRFTGPLASPHILEVCLASWLWESPDLDFREQQWKGGKKVLPKTLWRVRTFYFLWLSMLLKPFLFFFFLRDIYSNSCYYSELCFFICTFFTLEEMP